MRQIEAITAWRPAGVIAVPCDGSFPARAVLERDGIPFVVIDRPLDDGGQVDTDRRRQCRCRLRGHTASAGDSAIGTCWSWSPPLPSATFASAWPASMPRSSTSPARRPSDRGRQRGGGDRRCVSGPAGAGAAANRDLHPEQRADAGTLKATAELGLKSRATSRCWALTTMTGWRCSALARAIRQPVAEMAHAAWNRLASLPGPSPWRAPRAMPRPAALHPRLARLGGGTPDVRIGRPPAARGAAAMTGRTEHHDLDPTSSAAARRAPPRWR